MTKDEEQQRAWGLAGLALLLWWLWRRSSTEDALVTITTDQGDLVVDISDEEINRLFSDGVLTLDEAVMLRRARDGEPYTPAVFDVAIEKLAEYFTQVET